MDINDSTPSRSLVACRVETASKDDVLDQLSALFDAHAPGLLSYLSRRIADGAVAEELAAEAFARLLSALQQGHKPDNPIGWLYKTANNLLVDHYRRRGRRPLAPLSAASRHPAAEGDVTGKVEQRLDVERLQAALIRLSPEQQQVLTLRFGQGLSAAETAQLLAMSESAVWSHQHRGLVTLRKLLGE